MSVAIFPLLYLDSLATDDYATGAYVVTRPGAPTFVDGISVPGANTTLSINASVQPLIPIELARLPEGSRSDDFRAIFTDAQLNTVESSQMPDLIAVDGDVFQVVKSERFKETGNYHRAVLQRVGRVGTNS